MPVPSTSLSLLDRARPGRRRVVAEADRPLYAAGPPLGPPLPGPVLRCRGRRTGRPGRSGPRTTRVRAQPEPGGVPGLAPFDHRQSPAGRLAGPTPRRRRRRGPRPTRRTGGPLQRAEPRLGRGARPARPDHPARLDPAGVPAGDLAGVRGDRPGRSPGGRGRRRAGNVDQRRPDRQVPRAEAVASEGRRPGRVNSPDS